MKIQHDPMWMSRPERSLLLYLEHCAVECGGETERKRLNAEDMATMKKWEPALIETRGRLVRLTDEGWRAAGELRRSKAEDTLLSRQEGSKYYMSPAATVK